MLAPNRTTTLLSFLAASILGALASPAQASAEQPVMPIDFAHAPARPNLAPADHTTLITIHTAMQAGGECAPQWMPGFAGSGVIGLVNAFAVFDDGLGGGPALYAGGLFETIGAVSASHIAKWDGSAWSPLGSGMNDYVSALAVFDDGNGPALYAAGYFWIAGGVTTSRVARWDGIEWSGLGGVFQDEVHALVVFDDGAGDGPALYAGGEFNHVGGVIVNKIAKWDGSTWHALGSGVSGEAHNIEVRSLAVFDDGTGPALYVGGRFAIAGGIEANNIAKWDGTAWSPLANGAGSSNNDWVLALAVFDDGLGGGSALYAGGRFTLAGAVNARHVAKWDGSTWSALGSGIGAESANWVGAFAVLDEGSGSALYVGGRFTSAGGVTTNRIARWNGSAWSSVGSGMSAGVTVPYVRALVAWDGVDGPSLVAGGYFVEADGMVVDSIAKWDGSGWSALPAENGVSRLVNALGVFDDGSGDGPAVYAGGTFSSAGQIIANSIAKFDGETWSPLGGGVSLDGGGGAQVNALTVYDDGEGSGPLLFAGGRFTHADGVAVNHIASWDGHAWSSLGSLVVGVSGWGTPSVIALTVFDDGEGPALYAGGDFTNSGWITLNGIGKWNGVGWSPLGEGMSSRVFALTVFDDGSGPALYAGGWFTNAGRVVANRIAKWDGSEWSPLGSGMNTSVNALAVFDDGSGSGPALYAGGAFTTAGGMDAQYIAKWDGSDWHALGSGMNGGVYALTVFDDGSGPALIAGGNFTTAGGVEANRIARWDGRAWHAMETGLDGWVSDFAIVQGKPGSESSLYVSGAFGAAGGLPSSYIAKWQGCAPTSAPCPADFTGDGIVNLTDLLTLFASWGECEECPEDLSGDGVVDGADLLLLLEAWGECS